MYRSPIVVFHCKVGGNGLSLTPESNHPHLMKTSATPGGKRLRALREYYGRTQLDVELDASLGTGYLQRIESGKVQQPERATLERILAALGARYTERSHVLELFGYVVDTPLPDEAELQWAIDACRAEIDAAVFPAYLLDCAHRLLAWNALVPPLFQLDQRALAARPSMLRISFDTAYPVAGRIANPDVFLPAQIRALRYEMHWLQDEAWHAALLAEMLRVPRFAAAWRAADQAPPSPVAGRPLALFQLDLPETGLLQFRLIAEPFGDDRRFRMLYSLPADPKTIRQCLAWLQP